MLARTCFNNYHATHIIKKEKKVETGFTSSYFEMPSELGYLFPAFAGCWWYGVSLGPHHLSFLFFPHSTHLYPKFSWRHIGCFLVLRRLGETIRKGDTALILLCGTMRAPPSHLGRRSLIRTTLEINCGVSWASVCFWFDSWRSLFLWHESES